MDLVVLAQQATLNLTLSGVLALVAGILILAVPRLLNYVVAIYLIVIGLISVFDLSL
ncbi:MAG: DUF3096 domain-containing protein [Nitriliruptorales bacterium]